jgi:hypothetical protein
MQCSEPDSNGHGRRCAPRCARHGHRLPQDETACATQSCQRQSALGATQIHLAELTFFAPTIHHLMHLIPPNTISAPTKTRLVFGFGFFFFVGGDELPGPWRDLFLDPCVRGSYTAHSCVMARDGDVVRPFWLILNQTARIRCNIPKLY